MSAPLLEAGDSLIWTSGAGGTRKEKSGKVIGVIGPGTAPQDALRSLGIAFSPSSVKSHSAGESVRYLVAVPRGKHTTAVDYYTPLVATIDNALRRAVAQPINGGVFPRRASREGGDAC